MGKSVTMTFLSRDSAGAIGFLNALINEGASGLEKAQIGNPSTNAREKGMKNSAVFKFGDSAAVKAFRQADKKKLETNYGVTDIKYDTEN